MCTVRVMRLMFERRRGHGRRAERPRASTRSRSGNTKLRRLRLRTHMGALVSTIRETRARVLHSHVGNLGWANARVAERAGLKHVVTFYGYDVNMLPRSEPRWRARYEELKAAGGQ